MPRGKHEHCPCPKILRGLARPCILLLICETGEIHGYEISSGLAEIGLDFGNDTGRIYRILRRLESQGLVASSWDTSGSGPARRLYGITDDGREFLLDWQESIPQAIQFLQQLDERMKTCRREVRD